MPDSELTYSSPAKTKFSPVISELVKSPFVPEPIDIDAGVSLSGSHPLASPALKLDNILLSFPEYTPEKTAENNTPQKEPAFNPHIQAVRKLAFSPKIHTTPKNKWLEDACLMVIL